MSERAPPHPSSIYVDFGGITDSDTQAMNAEAGKYGDSPVHPIVDRAHEFTIVRFDLHNDPDDWRNSFLDLWLRRRDELRRLRFLRPRSIRIGDGFPQRTGGMIILDVRHRQWDDVGVEVADFEASHGAVRFYAAAVIDLDKAPDSPEARY